MYTEYTGGIQLLSWYQVYSGIQVYSHPSGLDTPDFNEYMPPPETGQPTFPQQWDQTILDEQSWLQIAWCFDEDGFFLPRKALHPPEDLVKLVPTGLSRSRAFTEVRPPEDVMERLRQERNHTAYQGRYPPSRGAIYSTKGHPLLDEQTLECVRKMREVPKYRKGDSWDAWEVKFVDWFDDVGKHISDIEQVEPLICNQPAEDEEKWRTAKRDFCLDFFGLFRHISVDGRRCANLSDYYQKWRNMSLPPKRISPQKFVEFHTEWQKAGRKVVGGVLCFWAHEYLMHVLREHRDTGKTPVFKEAIKEIYRRQARAGRRYSHMELFLVVMPFLLVEEDQEFAEQAYASANLRAVAAYRGRSPHRSRERSRSRSQGRGESDKYKRDHYGRGAGPGRSPSPRRSDNNRNYRSRGFSKGRDDQRGYSNGRNDNKDKERRSRSPRPRDDRRSRERSYSRDSDKSNDQGRDRKEKGRGYSRDRERSWDRVPTPRKGERDRSGSRRRGDDHTRHRSSQGEQRRRSGSRANSEARPRSSDGRKSPRSGSQTRDPCSVVVS